MKKYFTGFAVVLVVFLGVNLLAAHLMSDCGLPAVFNLDACADDIARAGWPLKFYEQGGFAPRSLFDMTALLADAGIGLILSALAGWASAARSGGQDTRK